MDIIDRPAAATIARLLFDKEEIKPRHSTALTGNCLQGSFRRRDRTIITAWGIPFD